MKSMSLVVSGVLSVVAAICGATALMWSGVSDAQSGRGMMSGYVAFAADHAPAVHASVELISVTPYNQAHYQMETDDAGIYHFPPIMMGEYRMKISAPGFKSYETTLYIPSDFEGHLAVMLKPKSGKKGDKQ